MTKGLEIARAWRNEDGTDSRLAEMINEALKEVTAQRDAAALCADDLKKSHDLTTGELLSAQAKLSAIVQITENSPGCDPVAAVRHLCVNAGDMVKELTKLRGEVQTYREMADKRGDLLEQCRAELRDAKKR